jgi:hypothetical protein
MSQNPVFQAPRRSGCFTEDNFVAEHCGVSSLVIHPEDPKLKLDERNGLLSPVEIEIGQ